ncbi:hypothetical protein AGR7A_pAt20222 [Agrobacterium deltaense NCPPB 1641]|uniref:Uncharacterized protein n=1 Tax=Agrobacterium deltaense NCPPB 1641 TaxID=1183425 RepID=A0A1S7U983_9HYPH|nr:hypothetical protein AGR7A_pAt20222 [Agrobacterium deltaense NCPPB 1641]
MTQLRLFSRFWAACDRQVSINISDLAIRHRLIAEETAQEVIIPANEGIGQRSNAWRSIRRS